MSVADLCDSLGRLASIVRAETRQQATAHGLKLVQLEALHYLASCLTFSRTPAGLSEYLDLTKGTVSQTLKALESKGLIEKYGDESDARIVHCELTTEGRKIARSTQLPGFVRKLERSLGPRQVKAQLTGLQALTAEAQAIRHQRVFERCGECKACKQLLRGKNGGVDVELAERMGRLGSVFRAEIRQLATAQGLKLVQLEALQYLASCERDMDTPSGLSRHLDLTKGTVSQTLKAIETKGLIEKRDDANDARIVHCVLTPQGKKMLRSAYPPAMVKKLARKLGSSGMESHLRNLGYLLEATEEVRAAA